MCKLIENFETSCVNYIISDPVYSAIVRRGRGGSGDPGLLSPVSSQSSELPDPPGFAPTEEEDADDNADDDDDDEVTPTEPSLYTHSWATEYSE